MDSKISLGALKCVGTASCVGGKHPDPPLDAFPLLAWMVSHPRHGSKVFTEDRQPRSRPSRSRWPPRPTTRRWRPSTAPQRSTSGRRLSMRSMQDF